MLHLAYQIAVIAMLAGVSAWPTRTARAVTHRSHRAWRDRRLTRNRRLHGFPTAAARHAELVARVEHLQELDPAAAEIDVVERVLDRHVELCVATARRAEAVRGGDELGVARIDRAPTLRGFAAELAHIDAMVARLGAQIDDPSELPDADELAAYVRGLAQAVRGAGPPRAAVV